MTSEEKAKELVEKFLSPTKVYHEHLGWVNYLDSAKECALIAVDEIIQSRQDDGHFDDTLSSTGSEYYTPHPMYLTYWLQVKNEIEKL